MAGKIFKEDTARILLRVHQTKFTFRKSQNKNLRVQDLLLAEEPERLEAMLQCDKAIRLVVRYTIREEENLSSENESEIGVGDREDKHNSLDQLALP